MLFDLRGRGRRRAIQVIYASLALLMGGGLVFFGIGGNTSGGLFDAFRDSSNDANVNQAFQKRVEAAEARAAANPRDPAALAALAGMRFQQATSGEGFDQSTGSYTDKGKEQLRGAERAWDKYLALDPEKLDVRIANQMVQAFGSAGLREFDKAVRAAEIVIEDKDTPTSALYAQLAVLAGAAGQDRKATLATKKAVELAPTKEQKDAIEQQIDLARQQVTQPQPEQAAG